jgi:hypothetical protein
MRSIVRRRPAPRTCEASSSAGSIDFITAPIITKATEPSNSAITQAMPHGVLMSIRCPSPPTMRQIWFRKPLLGEAISAQASAPISGVT